MMGVSKGLRRFGIEEGGVGGGAGEEIYVWDEIMGSPTTALYTPPLFPPLNH